MRAHAGQRVGVPLRVAIDREALHTNAHRLAPLPAGFLGRLRFRRVQAIGDEMHREVDVPAA